jgi:CHAD domain-containing protein
VLLKRFSGDKKNEAAEMLRERLQAERETAYAAVLEALGSKQLRVMMIDLVAWIETGKWRSANGMAAMPLPDFASGRLDKRWRKVKKGGAALTQLDPEPRHQLRIEVKKLRYAVEFSPPSRRAARPPTSRLHSLQRSKRCRSSLAN